jgi:release factor glutamine methyltransferase
LSTAQELFLKGRSLLKEFPNPHLEAKLLLLESASISEEKFYSSPGTKFSRAQERRFYKLISKRLAGFPISYLTGTREFWSIPFRVYPGVLIPRPETELIVEKVLELAPPEEAAIADIGTGCGNIAVSLAVEMPGARIIATDTARKALRVAGLNASLQNITTITFAQGRLFSPLKRLHLEGNCDFIVSNPPYLSEKEWSRLAEEIKNHEPKRALVAGETGLEVIRELILGAPLYLKSGGFLLLEIGQSQKKNVELFFDYDSRWEEVDFFKDLAGKVRVASGKMI